MADPWQQRRPRLAYPFTILTDVNMVRLVAGEDHRYTLTAAGLERWLPTLLGRCDGRTLGELLGAMPVEDRAAALQLVQQLYGERVLVDASAADAHLARKYRVILEGFPGLNPSTLTGQDQSLPPLMVLWQNRLDYEEALACHRHCRTTMRPLLWVSHAPLTRAYVSPLFLPDAGPCFGCLLRSFRRLSPAPELYDALREHARASRPIEPVEFPQEGLLVLEGIVRWKLQQAELPEPGPGLYRLHVLEREHFEVSTHRVFVDPHCSECKERA